MAAIIAISSDQLIRHCEERLLRFVQNDAYEAYDFGAGYQRKSRESPLTVKRSDLVAVNSAMRARSPVKPWVELTAAFTRDFAGDLAGIPGELDLIDSATEEVEAGNSALSKMVREIAGHRGLTDMAASKVLHLLRPRFVAISDSYVRQSLGVPEWCESYGRVKEGVCAERMHAVQRRMREVGRANKEALSSLYELAERSHKKKASGEPVPVKLSKLRILDILLWTEGAIKNHSAWKEWYEGLRC